MGDTRDGRARPTARGVCPECRRPLVCASFTPPTSTWCCSSARCSYSVEMPRATMLYRRARLEHGDTPRDGHGHYRGAAR
jgi:hypothetical protein